MAAATLIAHAPAAANRLTAEGGRLVLAMDGRRLLSPDLLGAALIVPVIDADQGAARLVEVRIDAVRTAADAPGIVLHEMTIAAGAGAREPLCAPDAQGRNAAYAMRGRISEAGDFVPDADSFFLACTSGAVGKCVLWGYDPWRSRPGGGSLARHYEACLRMTRADYLGDGAAHTRDGTPIDLADSAGVRRWTSERDPRFVFEAGWGPRGAVCVERVRWPDLADPRALRHARPDLHGRCNRHRAEQRGALLFTRILRAAAER